MDGYLTVVVHSEKSQSSHRRFVHCFSFSFLLFCKYKQLKKVHQVQYQLALFQLQERFCNNLQIMRNVSKRCKM